MQYIMKGGNPLVGDVLISGAKNAALGILAAAVMTDDTVIIDNLPDVQDINVMLSALEEIGVSVERPDRHVVKLNGSNIHTVRVDNEYIRQMRAGYYLVGALLGKYRHAEVALPGGCNIGQRPIDLHLKGFNSLHAKAGIEHGMVVADATELRGSHVYMDVVSVGATINVMLAAALAHGDTFIENAAREPHVVDVANMLNSMGANIRGAGTETIRIRGVERLHGTDYSIIPDQIEAGTFMFAAAVTRGDVTVKNIIPKHMEAICSKLKDMGCEIVEDDDTIRVVSRPRLISCNVRTSPYPGFPTDMQPQIGVAMCLAEGSGIINESIFENRFKYLDELTKMGADAKAKGMTAFIRGVERLTGAEVNALDLRAGAALVLAGLAADGITTVNNIHYILRGYENFDEKLRGLGAVIEIVKDPKESRKFRLRVS